jgi:uncharacterized caspase-like protein
LALGPHSLYGQAKRGGGFTNFALTTAQGEKLILQKKSYALLIGMSQYRFWSKLPGVASDIRAVQSILEKQGFIVEVVLDATRPQLYNAFQNFINKYGREAENRLLFYYAGHGYTAELAYGEEMGYIVPKEAPRPNLDMKGFKQSAMDMEQILNFARNIESKHVMFIFDSCFSGSLFARNRGEETPPAIQRKSALPVRQFITSGSANQTVPDKSIFCQQLVRALGGAADMDKDGYVTGNELGYFLETAVSNYSRNSQTPQYGKIRDPALDQGDFIFDVRSSQNAPIQAYGSLTKKNENQNAAMVSGKHTPNLVPSPSKNKPKSSFAKKNENQDISTADALEGMTGSYSEQNKDKNVTEDASGMMSGGYPGQDQNTKSPQFSAPDGYQSSYSGNVNSESPISAQPKEGESSKKFALLSTGLCGAIGLATGGYFYADMWQTESAATFDKDLEYAIGFGGGGAIFSGIAAYLYWKNFYKENDDKTAKISFSPMLNTNYRDRMVISAGWMW